MERDRERERESLCGGLGGGIKGTEARRKETQRGQAASPQLVIRVQSSTDCWREGVREEGMEGRKEGRAATV